MTMIQALNKVLLLGCIAKPIQSRSQPGNSLTMVRLVLAGIPVSEGDTLGWSHTVYVMGDMAQRCATELKPGMPVLVEGSFFYSEAKSQDKDKQSTLRVRATRVMRVERAEEDIVRDPQGGYWLRHALNQVSVIGNVTRDALTKQRRDGSPFVLLPLALNESWRNREGTQERRAHFVPIICTGRSAELAALVKRGEPVLANGALLSILRPDPINPGRFRSSVQVGAEQIELLQGLTTQGVVVPLVAATESSLSAAD
jgi:single-strand DNA-binding protein